MSTGNAGLERPGPSVSVLIPAFDAERTLPLCLESIRRQALSHWECVIVDDGSRDATAAVARSFAARDRRFRVLDRPHRGIVASLNDGLDACRGALVARMDADDWMHRDRLALQHEALERDSGLAGVGCHVRIFPRAHMSDGRRSYESWLNAIETRDQVRAESFIECPIAHPSLMLRRSLLADLGFRDAGWPEDYDLVLRLLGAGESLAVVPRRLLGWRDTPDRLSRTHPSYAIERFTDCRAAFLAQGLLANDDEYLLWGYGDTGRSLRRALLAHGKRPSHIIELHPGRIGQRIHGAPVIDPTGLKDLGGRPLVASVAGLTARTRIRSALRELGRREGVDYVCAA
jgi:glycosyltransferase involved in cell wall biosynthesis